jgi:beta-lactam-binding protein with PASTA domain
MARRPVPADLEDALAASPAARERFWALPPEQLDGWVAWVERARFPGQRRRRVRETVRRLGGAPAVAATETREARAAAVPLPRDDWWVWLVGLALLAGLAAFLVWLTVYRHHHHSSPSAVVVTAKSTVPKVTGIKLQSAEFQLKEAKLGTKLVHRDSTKPRNIVIGQAPRADKQVVQGTIVTLVVSNGPPGAKVPKLEGLAAADAVKKLQALGFTATLHQVAAGGAPGTVVSQSPQPGKRAKRGTAVVLQVVKGTAKQATTTQAKTTTQATTTTKTTTQVHTTTAATTTTPTTTQSATGNDYRGMRLQAAVQKIAQGRQQVVVQYVTSSQPAGVVVANSNQGNKVLLQVSAGQHPKPATSIPDTTSEDESTAQSDLTGAGFTVLAVDWPVSDASTDGTVVYQTPTGQAPKGSTIVVYIGRTG